MSNSVEQNKKLSELESNEEKIMADLSLQFIHLDQQQNRTELDFKKEMAKVDEAWRDIYDNENEIKELTKRKLNATEKSKLRQRKTHIREAKALLIDEQQAVFDRYKKTMAKIKNNRNDLNGLKRKAIYNIHLKREQVFPSLNPKMFDIDKMVCAKRIELLDKQIALENSEQELENMEDMLKLSSESCNKQQQVMNLEKSLKMEDRSLKEHEIKSSIKELEGRLALLDNEYKETEANMKKDLRLVFRCALFNDIFSFSIAI